MKWIHTQKNIQTTHEEARNTHENKREIQHIIIIVIGSMLCVRALCVCFFPAFFRIFDILQIIHSVVYKSKKVSKPFVRFGFEGSTNKKLSR